MKRLAMGMMIILIVCYAIVPFVYAENIENIENMIDPGITESTESKGLVPCGDKGEPDCSLCYLFLMIKGLIDFLIKMAFIAISALIAYGGILYFISGGDQGKVKKARSIFTNAVFGLIIMLTSWLIVNSILVALGYAQENVGIKSVSNQFILECEDKN